MNQHEWRDAVQRLQRLLEPNCHNMGNVSRSNRDWDTYHELLRYTVPESHRSDLGWKELSPSSHHGYSKVPEMEDPDGEPLEESDGDAELARKKKKLREIEERIMHKKASIAMKAVFVESSTPPGVSGNEHLARCEGETLRDRVKEILRQRQHLSYLSKSNRERKNPSRLSKDGVLQEQHPLKLRVQALMKRRHSVLPFNSKEVPDGPRSPPGRSVTSPPKRDDIINKGFECFLSVLNKGVDISLLRPEDDCRKVPDVSQPPPGRRISSPAKEENNISKGFERFLNVLNKGVDIEKLRRIMNNDKEDIPLGEETLSIQLPDMESKSDLSFRSERQWTNSDVSLLGLSQASEKQQLNRGALLEGISQTSRSLHTMDNDAEPDLSWTKESQGLSSGASLLGLSPASENQHSNSKPIIRSLSRASESISSGASRPVCSKASDSEQPDSRVLLTGFNHVSESQLLNTGASLPALSPSCKNQRSDTRTIPLTLSRASESQRSKSGASQKSISQTNKSISSRASRSALGKASDSEQTDSGASPPGRSPPSENQRSNARPTELSLSRAKESKRLKSGALPTGLSQASKNQQSNKGLKGLRQASKSQRLKSDTFIPGLGETSDSESNDGSPLGGLSQAKTAETKINSPIRERPRSERLSLPDAREKKKDRGDHSLGSSSQSKSNMAVKKKKKKEEERQENPLVNEQHEQLQNILKTLGWNLDVEELSKLANRTQERLYGKKNEGAGSREEHESRPKLSHDRDCRKSSSSRSPLRSNKGDHSQERIYGRKSEGRRTESRGEEALEQRRSLRDHRKSPSCSSSFSSSSRSASSPSPSRQRRSRSRDLKQRRKVERSRSGERSRETPNSRETQRDRKDLEHFSPYPYPQNQMFPHPAASAFPDYILPQYSHFSLSHSGHYSGATNPYWTYNQYNIPPSLSASSHPYPQFSGSVVAPNMVYADPSLLIGSASFPNPDLSVSEGQVGSSSGPRCLTVINTEQASSQGLTGGHNLKFGYKKPVGDFSNPKNILEKHNNTPKSPVASQESKVCTKTVDDDLNAEQLEEKKSQPTEEEIKANLRKKLEAFNQKAKNTSQLPRSKVLQPAHSLISEME